MIEFNQVSKRYPNGHEALLNVSFHIHAGEIIFLTGHSGAGKSTLLKLIDCIEKPSAGEVIVNGQNLNCLPKRRVAHFRRQIGLIFQNPLLLNNYSVFDNIALPLNIAGYHHQEVGRRVRAALDKVGLLDKEKLSPETLSCGEQQRVNIARAIVTKPPIILADEPTGNLDPNLAEDTMQLFDLFNQAGVTIIIASHNISLISQFQHRILTLQEGQLIYKDEGGNHHE